MFPSGKVSVQLKVIFGLRLPLAGVSLLQPSPKELYGVPAFNRVSNEAFMKAVELTNVRRS